MLVKYSELKKKDVLNVETGKNLGKIIDLVIEESSGEIQKIIASGKRFALVPCDGEQIEYCKITKIGDDVILVSKRSKNCNSNCQNSSVIPPSGCCGQQNGNSSISFDYDEE
jgi:YlmC/YmxH family sporulation protein